MRHFNPTHRSLWHNHNRPYVCDKPYQRCYKYTHPTDKCWYVKILQYVYDHPGCSRNEILCGIFPRWFKTPADAKKWGRGYASNTFANMLFDDLIDYDKTYHYTIQKKGLEVLKRAYVDEILKKNFG